MADDEVERSDDEAPDEDAPEEDEGPVDQLGIPMSREPTIDDVRGGSGPHRRLAVGCSVAVAFALIAFWAVRVMMLGE